MKKSERAGDSLKGESSPALGLGSRRAFLSAFSAAGIGSSLLPGVLWARLQETNTGEAISTESVRSAEEICGLELTDEERELLVGGLNRNVASYRKLREVSIPNEIPPALIFEPLMPGVGNKIREAASDLGLGQVEAPATRAPADIAFSSVAELGARLRAGQLTATELTELYLDRLERYDPKLLCTVTLTRELALRQAARADSELKAGQDRGPLHGIPWGAKDLLSTVGYPTTWGAAPFKDQQIDADAAVVRKLDDAGAVLVAKLTLGALAMGDYWFNGQTRCPWNNRQGSSGSSAGPGAATVAGLVGFSIGTETRGSIVSPSTRNGCTGLRPTFGRVSRAGAMALSWSMDKIGPMCRTAEDCAIVFAAIHGRDADDPSSRSAPFQWDSHRNHEDLRVGFLESAFSEDERYRNRDLDLETLRVLTQDLEIDLIPIELPDFPIDACDFILLAEAAAAFDELTRSNRDDELTRQHGFAWPNSFRTSRFIPAVEYIQANRARTMYMRLLSERMQDIDVLVAPSFRGGQLGATNLTGQPCVSVPNGFDNRGLPASITFLANLYRDEDALRLAHAYQQVTDFHRKGPDLEGLADVADLTSPEPG